MNPADWCAKIVHENLGLLRTLARVRALTCEGVDLRDRPGTDTITVAELRAALNKETTVREVFRRLGAATYWLLQRLSGPSQATARMVWDDPTGLDEEKP